MKHILAAAIALAVLLGPAAMARDGDGHRSYNRGYSHDRHWDGRHSRGFDRRDFRQRDGGFRKDFRRDGYRSERRGWQYSKPYGFRDESYGFKDRSFRFKDRKHFDGKRFDRDRFFRRSSFSGRSWRRGDRLPRVFISSQFIIRDHRAFRLFDPPRGYRWVRVERDAFLTGVATGVIVAVAANQFY